MKERRYNLSVKRFLAWVIAIAVAVSILTVPQTESYAAGGKIKTIAVTNLPAKQLKRSHINRVTRKLQL